MRRGHESLGGYLLKKKFLTLSFLLNIVCICFSTLLFEVHFDTETDKFLNHIFAGAYGNNGSAYGCVNIFLGYSLKMLYSIVPGFSWYVCLQYILLFICFLIIINIILKKSLNWGGYITSVVFLIFMGYECYARVSYIKTAVICITTACFIFNQMLKGKISKKIYLIVGLGLFLLGSLWWNKAVLYAIVAVIIPYGFMVCDKESSIKISEKKIVLGIIIASFLGSGIFAGVNNAYIMSYPEVSEHVKYMNTWQQISDIGWPDYGEYRGEYEKLGISENTYYLLEQGEVVDGFVTDLKTLQEIKNWAKVPLFDYETVLEFTRTYPLHYFDTGLFFGFLVFFFLFFLSSAGNKVKKGVCIFLLSWLLYGISFLYGVDDTVVITTSIWIGIILVLLNMWDDITIESGELKKYYSFAAIVVVIIGINQKFYEITSIISAESSKKIVDILELADSDQTNVYITNSIDYFRKDLPFARVKQGALKSPLVARNAYLLYNSKDIGASIFEDNNKVRFFSQDYANRVAAFMNEKYGGEYYSVNIGVLQDNPLFIVRSGTLEISETSIEEMNLDISSDVYMYTNEEGMKIIEGNIYKKNSNSFSQKVYVEVYDKDSASRSYYDLIQGKNNEKTDVMNGKYSYVYAELEEILNAEYAILLEVDGELYRVGVNSDK